MEKQKATDEQAVEPEAEGGAVDSAKPEKTYTASEVDALIKARIDKQNAKHSQDKQAMEERIQELEKAAADAAKEREEMEARASVEKAKAAIAAETGVSASVLRGSTEEELRAHAAAVKAAYPVAPAFRDSGKPSPEKHVTKESILAIKNDRERLREIEKHIELF